MKKIGWHFPILSGGEGEEGYTSNDIEGFKGEDLYINLARETCQNSLDAKEPNTEGPVTVKYTLKFLKASSFQFFADYKRCLESCRDYWENRPDPIPERLAVLLSRAQKVIDSDEIPVLVISDFNTPGLLGSQDEPLSGSFNALVYATGVSYKESDTSAGSFGIGRNAPFACSDLSCICYNTKAKDGGEAFAGVSKLATMKNNEGKRTRSLGRYQYNNEEEEIWRPVRPSDNDDIANQFQREEIGTDVIIFGFNAEGEDGKDWATQLEMAILRNFFLAIYQEKLVVEIQEKRIDANTMPALFLNYDKNREMHLAHQYYKAIADPNSTHCNLSILNKNDAELFIRTSPEIEMLKSVAWFRSSGMLIKEYKPRGIFRPYVAVFIAKGELDKILRDTEPARHNDWDYHRIEKGTKKYRYAKEAVSKLKQDIKAELKKTCETVVDDTIDAIGAADFLPDNEEGHSHEGGGTDLLRPLIKIGKPRESSKEKPKEKVRGKKASGKSAKGRIGNHRKNPNPDPNAKPLQPVVEEGKDQGVSQGAGGKVIERNVPGKRRIFALAPDQGIYKLVIIPDKSINNVIATCEVLGENNKAEPVKIKTAMLEGKHLNINDEKSSIGPFDIKQNERSELVITFAESESMALSVKLGEREGTS